MEHTVIMPKQGLQMDEGTIIRWLVSEGEKCVKGEPLFEMETDKLTITIDSPASGLLRKILHPEGDTVPVTEAIAIISDAGEEGVLAERDIGTARPLEDEWVKLSPTRKAIAKKLYDAQKGIAWATIRMDVNMSRVKAYREDLKSRGEKCSITALIILAVARALKSNPWMNSVFQEDGVLLKKRIHIGFAVATERGLMVPVVKDANRKTACEIANEIDKLAEKARMNLLSAEDVTGSTFTLSNLGMMNVQSGEAIPNSPETGILCTGQVRDEAIVENGTIIIAPMMTMTLTYDHRVLDGADSAKFVDDVRKNLTGSDLF